MIYIMYLYNDEKLIKVIADLQNIHENLKHDVLGNFNMKYNSDLFIIMNKLGIIIKEFEKIMNKEELSIKIIKSYLL